MSFYFTAGGVLTAGAKWLKIRVVRGLGRGLREGRRRARRPQAAAALKFSERAVQGALHVGLVAEQSGQNRRTVGIADSGDICAAVLGSGKSEALLVGELAVEQAGFEAQGTAEAPGGGDDLANEDLFEGVGGEQLGAQGGLELVEGGAGLGGNDQVGGVDGQRKESVLGVLGVHTTSETSVRHGRGGYREVNAQVVEKTGKKRAKSAGMAF